MANFVVSDTYTHRNAHSFSNFGFDSRRNPNCTMDVNPRALSTFFWTLFFHIVALFAALGASLLRILYVCAVSMWKTARINTGAPLNSRPKAKFLAPLHRPMTASYPSSRGTSGVCSFATRTKSPAKELLLYSSLCSTRPSHSKRIQTEEELEHFLAEVDENIKESARRLASSPPTRNVFAVYGTHKLRPLMPVRECPATKKLTTPMSIEQSIQAFKNLGIYPQIEECRDRLSQWFSSVLLQPLLTKIENSHLKVMQAAAKLDIPVSISQIGTSAANPIVMSNNWKEASYYEEEYLHQLRASLVLAIDASMRNLPFKNSQLSPQQKSSKECIDAITEHQRLLALVRGELVKGLLPQRSVQAHKMVQRIRELAQGTCVKKYEYLGSREVYHELPTDSHLLLYLFCAFLAHPKWMLHEDRTPYVENPLFLGTLPPRDMPPDKYLSVVSGSPAEVLHSGGCIMAVGEQSPPLFSLFWNKEQKFSLQGRTAMWDSILLFCHRIKLDYRGIVGGVNIDFLAL